MPFFVTSATVAFGVSSRTRDSRRYLLGVIAVRPELVHVMPTAGTGTSEADVEAPGRIKNRIFLGEHTEYLVGTHELGDILALVPKHVEASDGGFSPGDEVRIGWRMSAALSLAER